MVQFITQDPFTDRYRQGIEFAQNRRLNDVNIDTSQFNLNEAQRLSSEQQARDAAVREALASLNPTQGGGQPQQQPGAFAAGAGGPPAVPAQQNPQQGAGSLYDRNRDLNQAVLSRLVDVPGAGGAALETAQGDLNQEWNFLKEGLSIAERDPGLAMQFYQSVGMPLPQGMEGILTDRDARANFSSILDEAESIYPGLTNAASRRQYVLGRMQGLTQVQATTNAGAPSTQAAAAPVNMNFRTDANGRLWGVDPRSGNAVPILDPQTGEQIMESAGTASSGQVQLTDQGYVLIDKGNATVTPLTLEDGTQLTGNAGGDGNGTAFTTDVTFSANLYAQMAGRDAPNNEDWERALNDQKLAKSNPEALIADYTDMILDASKDVYGNPRESFEAANAKARQLVSDLQQGDARRGSGAIQQTGTGSINNSALGGNSGNAGNSGNTIIEYDEYGKRIIQ